MQDGALPLIFDEAKVRECRDNASSLRNRAMAAEDRERRQALVRIAEEWDRLADEIEELVRASQQLRTERG